MTFRHNSSNIKVEDKFAPIPAGEYFFVIQDASEKTSKTGHPMIEMTLQLIEDEQFHGKTLKHYVVFLPEGSKGDGISVHFRKCIGVPYGGDDEVDARDWVGKKIRAKLKVEKREWEGKEYEGNKVAYVKPYGDDFPAVKTAESEIPF